MMRIEKAWNDERIVIIKEETLESDRDDLIPPVHKIYADVVIHMPDVRVTRVLSEFIDEDLFAPTWEIKGIYDRVDRKIEQWIPGSRDTWAPDDYNMGDDGRWEVRFVYEETVVDVDKNIEVKTALEKIKQDWLDNRIKIQKERREYVLKQEEVYRLRVLVPKEEARQRRLAERDAERKAFAEKQKIEKEEAEIWKSTNPFSALKEE
jgi:hypothetical protein